MGVRKAKGADILDCVRLAMVEELLSPGEHYLDEAYFKSFLDSEFFFVAEDDSKVVGFLIGEEETEDSAFLNAMAVDKEFRGKGVGGQLLQHFKDAVSKMGLKKICLFAPDWNVQTLKFYEKNGFVTTEKKYRYFVASL